MVRLWRIAQGGMGGPGPLPDAGGAGDQAAVMLDAFSEMSAAEHEMKPGG